MDDIIQYSHGWLGVKCQSTTNFVLTEGEIFLYEGRGLVSNLDNTDHCMVQRGKCITNTSIVLWSSNDVVSHCLYRRVGSFGAMKYGDHFVINELQVSFIIDKENTIITTNCGSDNPHLM
ncbi:hypothetical protein LOAG_16393 [Loa loa]|uniref:Uncharacterized protein n=1 Tax=Loa loa TaxID=7209 RepID=A0A1S0UMT6_LOALO|nr:hypothetical protein LOAG_16393 [Loa loa]EJD76718.1 hypothetical protein LOAG_16393 [Loa loa]